MGNKDSAVVVDFEALDEMKFTIGYNSPLLADHVLDYPSVPEDQHPGQSRRLLCAAALACFAATTYGALKARGARILSLKGQGMAFQREGASEVGSIDIKVEVKVADEDIPILDKVKKIMSKGCLITRSLAPGITVKHTIEQV